MTAKTLPTGEIVTLLQLLSLMLTYSCTKAQRYDNFFDNLSVNTSTFPLKYKNAHLFKCFLSFCCRFCRIIVYICAPIVLFISFVYEKTCIAFYHVIRCGCAPC